MYALLRTNDDKIIAMSQDINKLIDKCEIPANYWEPDETGRNYVASFMHPEYGFKLVYIISRVEEL